MKKGKEVIIIVVILVVTVLLCNLAFGINEIQKPKDLRDFLSQPPNSIYQIYGYSEETFLLYNIIALREACQSYELRIKALETQVAELKVMLLEQKKIQFSASVDLDKDGIKVVDPNS